MKRPSFFFLFVIIVAAGIFGTGFQCGSTDMTTAKLALQREDYKAAEVSLQKEVQKNPTNAEAWFLLGDCQLRNGKIEDMLHSFESCTKITNEYDTKINADKLYAWQVKLKEGVDNYNAMITADDNQKAPLSQKAIDAYNWAVKINPDSSMAYRNLAALYDVLENYDEEIKNLKKEQEITKQSSISRDIVNAYFKKAEALKAKGDMSAANQNYEEAIKEIIEVRKTDASDLDLLTLLIDLHIQLGKSNDAMPYIKEALEKDPSNKVLQYNLGNLLLQAEDFTGAVEHFKAAIASDNTFQDAYRNCAVALMKWGEKLKKDSEAKADPKKGGKDIDKSYIDKFKDAASLLKTLVGLKADDPNLWDALATAYANAGMTKDATQAFNEADRLRKNK